VSASEQKPFQEARYYLSALDPLHVGTGGYRLGRVDNTIVREPGSNLPKIPGSSIAGVCRAFTAMNPSINKYPECAGKGGNQGSEHCGSNSCPVCVSYGFSKGNENKSFQGLAQFSDARILFFPVHSMFGPVWITSESIMKEHVSTVALSDENKFKCFGLDKDKVNFGWCMLEREGQETLDATTFPGVPSEVKERLFLLSDKIFSRIVNDNLEVRTSVAIDPATGAAEDKALFTYEAIPRATILWFDVTYQPPGFFKIGKEAITLQLSVKEYVEMGIRYIEALGLGGMNTRGFGRAKWLEV